MPPKTLLEMAGAKPAPLRLREAVVVVIDAQHEYVDGALPLPDVQPALQEIGRLLVRARRVMTPVIHIVHLGQVACSRPVPMARKSRGRQPPPPTNRC
jgi:nicotinamidase-related amidase